MGILVFLLESHYSPLYILVARMACSETIEAEIAVLTKKYKAN